MLARQTKVLEALLRAGQFVELNPPPAPTPGFLRMVRELSDTIGRVQRAAAHQIYGDNSAQAGTVQLRDKMRILRDRHLRPLVAIARAGAEIYPELPLAITMPKRRQAVALLVAAADALRHAAEPYTHYMIECGRPHDFLERLDAAIQDVLRAQNERTEARHLEIGATAGLKFHLRRARRVLAVVESHILEAHAGDDVKLAEWRSAKRVHLIRRASQPVDSTRPVVTTEAPATDRERASVPLQLVSAA